MISKDLPPDTADSMQTEPAVNIGEFFASKQLIRTYIAAALGILSGVINLTVDEGLINDLTTIVFYTWPLVLAGVAKFEQTQLAREQAKETRANVYAPSTVQSLIEDAKASPVSDPSTWGVNRPVSEGPKD